MEIDYAITSTKTNETPFMLKSKDKMAIPGETELMQVALKGKTPSEEASIKVDGKNRWKTIIENASLYKANSI